MRFNLSHSGEYALLAVATGREVGIDIEKTVVCDYLDVATEVFSPYECAALKETPYDQRLDAFYRCWTRKESFVKAHGEGLSFPMNGFDVSLERYAPRLLLACDYAPREMARWTIMPVPSVVGYSASLTVEGTDCNCLCWDASEVPSIASLAKAERQLTSEP